jgi:wobble nucleotide-excising tRNase
VKIFFFDEGIAEPILILGAADIGKQQELSRKREQVTILRDEIHRISSSRRDIEIALDKALITVARDNIKNPLKRLNYDKAKLVLKVDACRTNPAEGILPELEYSRVLEIYNSTDKKASIPSLSPFALMPILALASRVADVSLRSVKSVTIKAVAENPELEQWVNQGRSLHEGRTQCQFCQGPLSANLLSQLADHFSTDYDKLMADLAELEGDLNRAINQTLQLPQSGFFYADLSVPFLEIASDLNRLMNERRDSLRFLLGSVSIKKTKAYTPLTCPTVADNAGAISVLLNKITELITANNERSNEFDKNREAAFKKLERHCASQFAVDQDYEAKRKRIQELTKEEKEKISSKAVLDHEMALLEQELSESVKGAETINDLMRAYFGKNDLRITVSEDKRFRITRNNVVAKNLSEGERSAIAFVHFMTRLLDQKHPLAETTVVVDDPMCSLDANHLFNTYSFLKTKLSGCYQLFVLTHNYEFYSLIKEWALDDEKGRKDQSQDKWKEWSIYLVRRKDDGTSTIEAIPPALLKFKSEYHYLFATLLRFQERTGPDYDYLFSLPNVARRFMEAFGGIMIPTHQGLRSKLPRLIADEVQRERVWKFINDFSHNNSLNRSLAIPDVSECRVVVEACLNAVKRWSDAYYHDLVEAVQ